MKEANSFIDIKTTTGHFFTIFGEVAGNLDLLLLGDDEWEKQLKQAATFHTL